MTDTTNLGQIKTNLGRGAYGGYELTKYIHVCNKNARTTIPFNMKGEGETKRKKRKKGKQGAREKETESGRRRPLPSSLL